MFRLLLRPCIQGGYQQEKKDRLSHNINILNAYLYQALKPIVIAMNPCLYLGKALRLFALSICLLPSPFIYGQVINTVIGGASINGKPATSVGLVVSMNGIAADNNNNLYFSTSGFNPILKVDGATGNISIFAGAGDPGATLTEGAPFLSASFVHPANFANDNQGNIYFTDGSFRLIELIVSTGTCHILVNGAAPTSSGDGGPITSARFRQINGLAIDNLNNLYIADVNTVRKVTAATGIVTTIAGTGTTGNSGNGGPAINAQFGAITALAVDANGNVFVNDNNNNQIRKITASTGIVTVYAGTGATGYSGDGGLATSATFSYPWNLGLDAVGNLYFAADNRIREVNASNGIITTFAGQSTGGYSGDGGPAINAKFNNVENLCVSPAGNIYVTDANNYVIRKIAAGTSIITTCAGDGKVGVSGIGGPIANAQLYYTQNIAVDNAGHIFLADNENQAVYKIDTTTQFITNYAAVGSPGGVAVDNTGNLYVVANTGIQIQKISPTGVKTTVAGSGSYGHTGDGGAATAATLNRASGVAVDKAGNIYIADQQNNCIRKVTAATGIITTIAGTGSAGYSGDGSAATSAQFNSPVGISVDAKGNLYIADNGNNVVRKIDAVTGIITTIAGTGIAGYSGDNGLAISAMINYPQQAVADTAGNVYISDQFNSRIRRVDAISGIITTFSGNGLAGYNGDGTPASSATLNNPVGLCFDASYNLYIGDMVNHRIRKITGIPASPTLGLLTGVVFYDKNGNGIMDANESYADSVSASLTQTGFHLSTLSKNGIFKMQANAGVYTLAIDSLPYYIRPAAQTVNLSAQNDTVYFGLQPIPGKQDLRIALVPISALRTSMPTTYRLFYENAGTASVNNVSLSYAFSNRGYVVHTTPANTGISADSSTLTWNLNTLAPAQTGSIDITTALYAPPIVNVNDYLHSLAYINPAAGDLTPADDTVRLTQLVTGSFDPNERSEIHGGTITPAQVAGGEYLTYYILFQNTGTDTAFKVVVRDTLDSQLDWTSFQMAGASHPYQLSFDGSGRLTWTFNNILLPDSNTNQQASHGFISFRIKPLGSLHSGNTISGRSSIYFDSNLPVLTNTVTTTVQDIAANTLLLAANVASAYCDSAGSQKMTISGLPADASPWVRLNETGLVVDASGAFTWTPAQLATRKNSLHIGYTNVGGENAVVYPFAVEAAVTPKVTLSASQTNATAGIVLTATNTQGGGSNPLYAFARDRNFTDVLQAAGPANTASISSGELPNGDSWIYTQMTTSDSCYTHLTATDSVKLTRNTPTVGIRNPDDPSVYVYSYPNPFVTSLTITGLTATKTYLVQVYNGLGGIVSTLMISGVQSKTISTAAWSDGNYRVSITDMTANKRLGVLAVSKL